MHVLQVLSELVRRGKSQECSENSIYAAISVAELHGIRCTLGPCYTNHAPSHMPQATSHMPQTTNHKPQVTWHGVACHMCIGFQVATSDDVLRPPGPTELEFMALLDAEIEKASTCMRMHMHTCICVVCSHTYVLTLYTRAGPTYGG